jgi:adenine-specific DNA-methyltransferase
MNETELNGESKDIVAENIEQLRALFPEVFAEESIDFKKLKAVLGEYIDDDEERYNFTWWGKSKALRLAQTPSTGTLRPCPEESKDWDSTQNLYIEGDNLEVLKLLQKTYHNKVKMIYIDPPYNTGKDFVYPDNYKDNLKNYFEITGQVTEGGQKTSTNSESSGRYHTNWLNMMYPRLRLARNLLSDKGLIFISIDDNEVNNLKKITNEVFGDENFIAIFPWKGRGGRQDSKTYAFIHEYIICYTKNLTSFVAGEEIKVGEVFPKYDEDKKRNYKTQLARKWGSNSRRQDRPNLYYPIVAPDGVKVFPMLSDTNEGCWRWGKTRMEQELAAGNVEFLKKDNTWVAYEKNYEPLDGEKNTKKYSSWLDNVGSTANGSDEMTALFSKGIFDFPKPTSLITHLMKMGNVSENDIVLDFFSGSATTADSILRLTSEDEKKRKYVMVQMPELVDEKSNAYKAGYKNIAEIGKERIRRAGDKIKAELAEKYDAQQGQMLVADEDRVMNPDELDIGFKVFKLDSSNLKKWHPDADELEESLFDSIDNFVDGRSELDMVYEIMLKYGIDLTLPIETYTAGNKKIYSVGLGALIICLDNEITTEVAQEIVKLKAKLSPEVMRVVFKDNGFKDDSAKTNAKEILRTNGVDEIVSI